MLIGAKEAMKNFAPKISICTYNLEDIIKKANPNYIVKHRWEKLYTYMIIYN